MIVSPQRVWDYPEHTTDCEEAMRSEFLALVHRGETAGWSADTVAAALLSLSLGRVQSRRKYSTSELERTGFLSLQEGRPRGRAEE